MKFDLFNVKIKDKNTKINKILELLKLSFGNNIANLNYNKKNSQNQNLEIIVNCDKICIKKNIGKMIYKANKNKEIKIFNEEFISNNKNRAKMIIYNKQYELKEIVENQKQSSKIEIKFLDNIIYLNSMFKDCKSLSCIYNLKNLNTKYLREIYGLFEGCNSLINLDDISNWNLNNINY